MSFFREFARWKNGQFTLNPFDLTQEQLMQVAKKNNEEIEEILPGIQQIKYKKDYWWGCITQHIIKKLDSNIQYHEILVHYYCPKYEKSRQIEWLRANSYYNDIRVR